MVYQYNGNPIHIPDDEVATLMEKMSITKNAAVQLWLEDSGVLTNAAQHEADVKAKAVAKRKYEKSGKERKPTTRERKPDEDKRAIMAALLAAFPDGEMVNLERELAISYNGASYSIVLTKHREKSA